MTRAEYKRNTWLLGLFWSFSGVNALTAGALGGGIGPMMAMGAALFLAACAIVFDHREKNKDKIAVWAGAVSHLLITAFVLVRAFHWAVVILYLLELSLCISIWRKKR